MMSHPFGRRSLAPRILALVAYRESVERFAVALAREPVQLDGFNDPTEALDELSNEIVDTAVVNVPWGDEFDRSLLETIQGLAPSAGIIALVRTDEAARRLEADPNLLLSAILVEPWSPAQLCRAVRASLFEKSVPEPRAAQGALGSRESAGRSDTPSLLPLQTLPALLRLAGTAGLWAGNLLFPKTPDDARQGALGRTEPELEVSRRMAGTAGLTAGTAGLMAKTLVGNVGQGPARVPAGGYVSA